MTRCRAPWRITSLSTSPSRIRTSLPSERSRPITTPRVSTSRRSRRVGRGSPTQTQDTSESFENPFTCITIAPDCGELPFYGANGVGSGPVVGTETDPSSQFSEELRIASTADGPLKGVAGVFYSDFKSQWQLNTQSENNLSYVDFSNFTTPAATTTVWGLNEPAHIRQWALFGEGTWAVTPRLQGHRRPACVLLHQRSVHVLCRLGFTPGWCDALNHQCFAISERGGSEAQPVL